MCVLIKTNSGNDDFRALVKKLDKYLAIKDGDEHEFYDQFNKLDSIKNVVIIYEGNRPVGCGAFKEYRPLVAEIKRMYVEPDFRNKGYASKILSSLETWAKDNAYEKCILETGLRQTEAIKFYSKNKYMEIPNFPPYEEMANSRCFEKILS